MKATAEAIEVAKAAKQAMERINAALDAAHKRLTELGQDAEAIKTPRVQDAVEKIKVALGRAEITARMIQAIAVGALAVPPQSQVELSEHEIAALAFGIDA